MPIEPIPPETVRVARAAFPKGNRYLRVADELDTLFTDDAFLTLFPVHGQPTLPPWRLALATILQFGPVALKLRYHLIGSISLLRKTFLHHHRRLPSEGEFPLSAGTGTFWRPLSVSQPPFG
jgi:hypothetical protein